MGMHILLIGGGGREHALAEQLSRSKHCGRLTCAPGNAGIARVAECIPISAMQLDALVDFAVKNAVDFAVVAPDDPLAAGLVDALEQAGIPAFGPTKAAAEIEGSKIFAKRLMDAHNIPTASWQSFDNPDNARAYIRDRGAPIVVKADGLALGKGVVVARTVPQALEAVGDMMENKSRGQAGSRLVVEECMTGPEVTVLAFTDGKTIKPMPSSRDHKRASDGDTGPNTGGMGAVSPAPGYDPEIARVCMETIFLPTVRAMAADGRPFKGVLYFGLMLTPTGPQVVEYNARFGDPEAQAVLMLLETDLMDILMAVRDERLDEVDIEWSADAACCVVMASGGYPEKYETGVPISGLPVLTPDLRIFHAGTAQKDGRLVTAGGRVLGVTARAPSLEQAVTQAYEAVAGISFENAHFRSDIGAAKVSRKPSP